MVALITDGIKVSVETEYQADYSNPMQSEYLFSYRVTIENLSAEPMKLLRTHLEIFDYEVSNNELEGSGASGMQPIIGSGESYWYVSGHTFHSDMGSMKGQYVFRNLVTHRIHHIKLPTFELVAPFKNN